MTNHVAHKETEIEVPKTTELVTYESPRGIALLAENWEELRVSIAENIGSGRITPFILPRVKVPGGGGMSWQMKGLSEGDDDSRKVLSGVIVQWGTWRAYWDKPFGSGAT